MKIDIWRHHPAYRQLMLPIFLYILVYFFSPYVPHLSINISGPYMLEKALFNVKLLENSITINEWWQFHRTSSLDAIASLSYISFFIVFVILASYMYLTVPGKSKQFPIGWCLFWLGIAYLITSHLYPVAPPWYVAQYGLSDSIVNLHVHANAMACDNFDSMIRFKLCGNYIGNGPYPFGAMPSMHVGIPLLLVYYAFKYQKLKWVCILFYLIEIFSTLYLNQHYLIDLIAGSIYAFMIAIFIDKYYAWRTSGVY